MHLKICNLNFPDEYLKKHVAKRKKEGLIKNKEEYIKKIKEVLKYADEFYVVRQFSDCKDKLVFVYKKWCVWILVEESRIITTFYLQNETMKDFFRKRNIKKGLIEDCSFESYDEVNKNEDSKYGKIIKAIQDRC